jgi:hypothetical protein
MKTQQVKNEKKCTIIQTSTPNVSLKKRFRRKKAEIRKKNLK